MKNNNIFDIFLPYQQKFFLNPKKRKIWISSRQVGKSFTIAGLLVYKSLSKQNGLSLCISTGSRAASEIIRKCQMFAEYVKQSTKGKLDYTASYDCIKFNNGCRVMSLPSSTDGANLRGYTATCVCVDEGAYIWHLDDILQAINPTLSRDPDAELIFTTTPAGKNGDFYDLYQSALTDDDWYVQTTTIEDAINDGLKVDIESLKSLCPNPQVFAQEYMCQFSDSSNCLLNPDILQSYTEDENEENKDEYDYYMGVDFGRTHDATGIIILKKSRKEGKIYLKEKIKLNNCEYAKQFNLIREVFLKYNPKCCFCDAGGLGGPIVEELNRQVSSNIKGLTFNQTNKSEMFEYLRKVVFDRKLYIKSDFIKDIKNEIMMIRQIITDAGKTIYQANRTLDSHADLISALILALHGERQTPTNLQYPTSCNIFSHFGGRISRL